jgi:hypothetical protein
LDLVGLDSKKEQRVVYENMSQYLGLLPAIQTFIQGALFACAMILISIAVIGIYILLTRKTKKEDILVSLDSLEEKEHT